MLALRQMVLNYQLIAAGLSIVLAAGLSASMVLKKRARGAWRDLLTAVRQEEAAVRRDVEALIAELAATTPDSIEPNEAVAVTRAGFLEDARALARELPVEATGFGGDDIMELDMRLIEVLSLCLRASELAALSGCRPPAGNNPVRQYLTPTVAYHSRGAL